MHYMAEIKQHNISENTGKLAIFPIQKYSFQPYLKNPHECNEKLDRHNEHYLALEA